MASGESCPTSWEWLIGHAHTLFSHLSLQDHVPSWWLSVIGSGDCLLPVQNSLPDTTALHCLPVQGWGREERVSAHACVHLLHTLWWKVLETRDPQAGPGDFHGSQGCDMDEQWTP